MTIIIIRIYYAILLLSLGYSIYSFYGLGRELKKRQKNLLEGINPEVDVINTYLKKYHTMGESKKDITYSLLKRNIDFYKWLAVIIPGAGISSSISVAWSDYLSVDLHFMWLVPIFIGSSAIGFLLKKINTDVALYYAIKDYRESGADENEDYFKITE